MSYTKDDAYNLLRFLKDAERMKFTLRHSFTSQGRQESVAEHTWRMALMALALSHENHGVDINHVLKIILVHDLGEVYEGDTPAFLKKGDEPAEERKAVEQVVALLSKDVGEEILGLWNEYTEAKTSEAQFVKALDKLEVLIQHNEADIKTWIPLEREFNLTYGKEFTDANSITKSIREVVDEVSREKLNKE